MLQSLESTCSENALNWIWITYECLSEPGSKQSQQFSAMTELTAISFRVAVLHSALELSTSALGCFQCVSMEGTDSSRAAAIRALAG